MRLKFTSSKPRHPYDEDPATVRSAGNSRMKSVNAKLASNISAKTIISSIRRRDVVHRLDIGNSHLGDEGCVQLFNYLSSKAGQECRDNVTELYLTKNDIGAKGLLAVAKFLHGNEVIRELCLSGNPLTTDRDIITKFAAALNTSRLCTLQLIHSGTLSDSFICAFLPMLTTPYLRHLDLSAIGMTRAAVPAIVDYVSSPRCRLERLQCNANSLTLPGARSIIDAIDTSNYSLWKANLDDLHSDESDGNGDRRMLAWQDGWRILNGASRRNLQAKLQTRDDALAFLRYSRALFLRSGSGRRASAKPRLAGISPFFDLPTELQQEIFGFVAPGLSHRQRMSIVAFAVDKHTLPRLRKGLVAVQRRTRFARLCTRVTGSSFVEGPPFEGSWRPCSWWECECTGEARRECRALRRWRREMRDLWLTQVGCDVWDPGFMADGYRRTESM
ncbi:RNI-like protein [Leucogyrophana mollusca]|uniref:RNI-like protein n=1 Tax=Leucogyrophana mollusca TaxID=85980 RepID=A0ACB8BVE1_9AGAM|nr:RNI-like protein [Leucogyrophana mollusca]